VVEQRIRNKERIPVANPGKLIKSRHLTISSGAFFVFSLQFVAVERVDVGKARNESILTLGSFDFLNWPHGTG